MFLSKPRIALLSALTAAALVGSLGAATRPASAATQPRPAGAITAAGAILCSGDLCLQNDGFYNGAYVVVTEWAYNSNFYGHFELADAAGDVGNSTGGNKWWYAGGKGYGFLFPIHCGTTYTGTAWRYTGGHYYVNGRINFGVC
jgi:hypothetical protein